MSTKPSSVLIAAPSEWEEHPAKTKRQENKIAQRAAKAMCLAQGFIAPCAMNEENPKVLVFVFKLLSLYEFCPEQH